MSPFLRYLHLNREDSGSETRLNAKRRSAACQDEFGHSHACESNAKPTQGITSFLRRREIKPARMGYTTIHQGWGVRLGFTAEGNYLYDMAQESSISTYETSRTWFTMLIYSSPSFNPRLERCLAKKSLSETSLHTALASWEIQQRRKPSASNKVISLAHEKELLLLFQLHH